MRVVTTVGEARRERMLLGGSVGLVPTMGYLHRGHLSLVARARRECNAAMVSIFVNPTQFGLNEDLASYPRDLDRDLAMLREAEVDLVFVPDVGEMYPVPNGAYVDPGEIATKLEGAARPGHFRGVATVVTKLFDILLPDRAYFGQKDAQQLVVIRSVARDLFLQVEIVGCPTVREPDGLALSSRNVYLSPAERAAAPAIYRGLQSAERLWQGGERSAQRLREAVMQELEARPELRVEYVSVADPVTLDELEVVDSDALVSLAVRAGRARLIDNVVLGGEG